MHRNLGYLLEEIFRCTAFLCEQSQWFYKRSRSLSFLWNPTIQDYVEWFRLGPLRCCRWNCLANKLKKNGKLPLFYWRRSHKRGIFMKPWILLRFGNYLFFVIENNGYGFQHQQMSNTVENLADKGKGYGMESHIVDGNNIWKCCCYLNWLRWKKIHVRFIGI
jgi:hypothetical protein